MSIDYENGCPDLVGLATGAKSTHYTHTLAIAAARGEEGKKATRQPPSRKEKRKARSGPHTISLRYRNNTARIQVNEGETLHEVVAKVGVGPHHIETS